MSEWITVVACLFLAATSAAAVDASLEVVPEPRQVTWVGSGFLPAKARTIYVTDTAEDRLSAKLLRDALRESHGCDCDVVLTPPAISESHELRLSLGRQSAAPAPDVPKEYQLEGYGLRTDASGLCIKAATAAGLFYGVQTAIQLAEQAERDKAAIPGLSIVDWPALGLRGKYIEGWQCMGTIVMTRANLEEQINRLSRYKMNLIIIEMYNLAPFKSFPYCADANTLSQSDWEYLVEMAHSRHVVLMPSLQSFAQIYYVIWTCKEGEPYREQTQGGLICPSRPENIEFLQGLYRDLLSLFKYTPYLGIGCSEVRMQWQERYCPLCRKRIDSGETVFDIYYKHVGNCAAAVEAASKEVGRPVRPMMWADEFYMGYEGKRWVGIENIPKDLVMGHWMYWSCESNLPGQKRADYDSIAGLLERGHDTIYLSSSFEFNTYLHDLSPDEPKEGKWEALLDSGIYNIADQSKWAYTYAGKGYPGKMLGGGCATFSQHDIRCWDTTWYGYALQGEYSWGDPTRPLASLKERFTDNFAATYYAARTRKAARTIAAAYRDLDAAKSDIERNNYLIRDIIGEYDIHDASYQNNDLVASLKLIDELRAKPLEPGKSPADVRARAEKAQKVARSYRNRLAAVIPEVGNTRSLGYLISAAHKIENHAARTLYMLDQQAALATVQSAKDQSAGKQLSRDLDTLETRLAALRADTQTIYDEVSELTRSEQVAGYKSVMASLDTFKSRLAETRTVLSK